MTPTVNVVPGFDLSDEIVIFGKDQPQYIPLPAHKQPDGVVTIRWMPTWREKLAILLGGGIWHQVWTNNQPLQPVRLTTCCPLMGHAMGDEEV